MNWRRSRFLVFRWFLQGRLHVCVCVCENVFIIALFEPALQWIPKGVSPLLTATVALAAWCFNCALALDGSNVGITMGPRTPCCFTPSISPLGGAAKDKNKHKKTLNNRIGVSRQATSNGLCHETQLLTKDLTGNDQYYKHSSWTTHRWWYWLLLISLKADRHGKLANVMVHEQTHYIPWLHIMP